MKVSFFNSILFENVLFVAYYFKKTIYILCIMHLDGKSVPVSAAVSKMINYSVAVKAGF